MVGKRGKLNLFELVVYCDDEGTLVCLPYGLVVEVCWDEEPDEEPESDQSFGLAY